MAAIGAIAMVVGYLMTADGNVTAQGVLVNAAAGALIGLGLGFALSGTPAAAALARAAAQAAEASIAAIQQNQAKLTHIFDAAKHGFLAKGISAGTGLQLIGQTIAANIAKAGGPSNLVVGRVYTWSGAVDATTRVVVRGNWNGTIFQIGTSWLEVLVNGQWVPFTGAP